MSTSDSTSSIGVEQQGTDERTEYIRGLFNLARFLTDHPEVEFNPGTSPLTVLWFLLDRRGFAEAARTLGRAEKHGDENFFNLDRYFGPHKIQAYTGHETVCERVVVGTETVTKEIPDPELMAEVPTVTVTEEKEIVEWRCPPSLLAEPESIIPARSEAA